MNWIISVSIICIVLALVFSWQEYRRTDRRRLFWRLLAVWLAVAALGCIALPVTYNGTTQTAAQTTNAVLLTDGFNTDDINSSDSVFTTDASIKKRYKKSILLGSLEELRNHKPAFTGVRILGYGLTANELELLSDLPIGYRPPKRPTGLQSISWPATLKTGESLLVQGSFQNNEEKPVKFLFKGLNTVLDSIILPATKTTSFQLSTLPKPTGRVVYQLLALAGNDTLAAEDLPVQIEPTRPLKVLMLNAAPNFETRFLKNWLGENGYAVASRSVISKDKISEEYTNLDKLNLQKLSAGVLDRFDVVLGDLSALKSLTAAEGALLKQQVTQKGLGVIVRADSSDKAASWLQRDFPVTTVAVKEQPLVQLILQGQARKTAKLGIDAAYINYHNNTQSLATDAQRHELAGIALAGAGKVIFTTLNHTYSWLLAGNKTDYAALWSLLISKSARKLPPLQNWHIASALPSENEQVRLVLQSPVSPQDVIINGQKIAPEQSAAIPYEWNFSYWPHKTGWQVANSGNGPSFWWYNYAKTGWRSLKQLKRIAETSTFAAVQQKKMAVTKQIQQKIKIEVPKLIFYLLLLASCTFLWVERKFIS
ncbi:hypothetical protein [Mucilaginibacter sp. PAMB04168]|uniref:hypothetical protein n=1 Tax=Mucilaginibacter sp. PAMB04168 TaxID=3138567 RepID=UPI0031F6F4AF